VLPRALCKEGKKKKIEIEPVSEQSSTEAAAVRRAFKGVV
jgi:hypothetical protein